MTTDTIWFWCAMMAYIFIALPIIPLVGAFVIAIVSSLAFGVYQRAVKHIRVITCAKCKYWATVDCPLYGENTADDFCSKAEKWGK